MAARSSANSRFLQLRHSALGRNQPVAAFVLRHLLFDPQFGQVAGPRNHLIKGLRNRRPFQFPDCDQFVSKLAGTTVNGLHNFSANGARWSRRDARNGAPSPHSANRHLLQREQRSARLHASSPRYAAVRSSYG